MANLEKEVKKAVTGKGTGKKGKKGPAKKGGGSPVGKAKKAARDILK